MPDEPKVVTLGGATYTRDERAAADVEVVCEKAKALRRVCVVGVDHDGALHVSGSDPDPAHALWLLNAGALWFVTGGEAPFGQPWTWRDEEPEEPT